jgi:hypothetical protein
MRITGGSYCLIAVCRIKLSCAVFLTRVIVFRCSRMAGGEDDAQATHPLPRLPVVYVSSKRSQLAKVISTVQDSASRLCKLCEPGRVGSANTVYISPAGTTAKQSPEMYRHPSEQYGEAAGGGRVSACGTCGRDRFMNFLLRPRVSPPSHRFSSVHLRLVRHIASAPQLIIFFFPKSRAC